MSKFKVILDIFSKSKVLQALVDNTAKSLDDIQWKRWFKWKYTASLTFDGILAQGARVFAGSVVDYGARAPRRERPTALPFTGTLSSLKDGYQLDHKELRRFLELEDAMRSGRIENSSALFDELFPDIKALLMAPHKRMDMWAGEIISNGTITVAASDNPHGVNYAIDFSVPKDKVITKAWSLSYTDHKPLSDIRTILDEQKAKGKVFAKIKMTRSTFNKMVHSAEFAGLFGLKIEQGKTTYTQNPTNVITPDMVNMQFEAVGLPTIELVDFGVEIASGSVVFPFKDDRIVFHNGDEFGDAYYTYANEERLPVANVTYAKNDNVLMKYKIQEDFRLFEYELNSFLVPKTVSNMLIVDTANKRA
jgi:hypothetical protein